MGFVAKELAQGTIASGSTGDNTIYTVPGATTAHVIHMTLAFADNTDSALIKAGPSGSERAVVSLDPATDDEPIDCGAAHPRDETAQRAVGTIGNKIIETGGKIIINKTGSGGAITYSVSGYEIT